MGFVWRRQGAAAVTLHHVTHLSLPPFTCQRNAIIMNLSFTQPFLCLSPGHHVVSHIHPSFSNFGVFIITSFFVSPPLVFRCPPTNFRTSIPNAAIGTTSNTSLKIVRYPEPVFPQRQPLPKTHGIRVASLLLSAHHPNKLDLFAKFAWHSAHSLGIPAARPAPREKHRELITVPKAPFVHKKYQENFERRHHHREIIAYDANRETIDLWLQYLAKNAIGGLGMKAQIHEYVEPGFAKMEAESFGEMSATDIEAAAERILKELEAEEQPESEETKEAAGGLTGETSQERPRKSIEALLSGPANPGQEA
jgi:small subunit ribosomal protein S10